MNNKVEKVLLGRVDAYLNNSNSLRIDELGTLLNDVSMYFAFNNQNVGIAPSDEQKENINKWINIIGHLQIDIVERENEAVQFFLVFRNNLSKLTDERLMAILYLSDIYQMLVQLHKDEELGINIHFWSEAQPILTEEAKRRNLNTASANVKVDVSYEEEEEKDETLQPKPKKTLLKRFRENPKDLSKKELQELMDRHIDIISAIQKEISSRE